MAEARWSIGSGALILRQGDITASTAQAVVNAANSRLAGGGGVDGAIQRAAGPRLLEAGLAHVAAHGPVVAGQAAVTPGFDLPAAFVVHAVGPVWRGGAHGEPLALASAYRRSLELAAAQGVKTIAFPAISCGAYGYPLELAAPVALDELRRGLTDGLVAEAALYVYSDSAYAAWLDAAARLLGQPEARE